MRVFEPGLSDDEFWHLDRIRQCGYMQLTADRWCARRVILKGLGVYEPDGKYKGRSAISNRIVFKMVFHRLVTVDGRLLRITQRGRTYAHKVLRQRAQPPEAVTPSRVQ